MNTELKERIDGVEGIVFELTVNNEILKFLSFNLHKESFNVQNNLGLAWIWKQFLGLQVIALYKLFKEGEKHSFSKLLNILKVNGACNLDQAFLDPLVNLQSDYANKPYEAIRSKYLAHQDLNVPEMGVNLLEMDQLISKIFQWFNELKGRLGLAPLAETKSIHASLAEVFSCIDEYDEIKDFLLSKLLNGVKTVSISEIQDIIKARENER
jgi:hypothetical protein